MDRRVAGDDGTTPRLIAHRGFADEAPENTVAALRTAAERPETDMVELDVRRCGSGEPVVVHDERVDRVTDAAGPVAAFDAGELADLSVLGSDEGVPTLRAALDAIPADVGVNVELKEREVAADAVEVAAAAANPILVSSFEPAALAAAREVAPGLRRAYVFDGRPRRGVETARELDCAYVHPRAWRCLSSLVIRRAHRAGMAVNAWTVNSGVLARVLARAGVDGLITDRHDVLTGRGRDRGTARED